jgi:hypothetical protein
MTLSMRPSHPMSHMVRREHLVVTIVWVYYSAQILLFGAEFTQVFARYRGEDVQPDEHAVRVEVVMGEFVEGDTGDHRDHSRNGEPAQP